MTLIINKSKNVYFFHDGNKKIMLKPYEEADVSDDFCSKISKLDGICKISKGNAKTIKVEVKSEKDEGKKLPTRTEKAKPKKQKVSVAETKEEAHNKDEKPNSGEPDNGEPDNGEPNDGV